MSVETKVAMEVPAKWQKRKVHILVPITPLTK